MINLSKYEQLVLCTNIKTNYQKECNLNIGLIG
jgi:hypothetical protein